jgi:hypothetical protein
MRRLPRPRLLTVLAIAVLCVLGAPSGSAVAQVVSATSQVPANKLVGTATGTTTWAAGVPGCDYVSQTFDATYAGGPGAGDVVLHMEVCVSAVIESVGTFRIETRIGSLSGTVAGDSVLGPVGVIFGFELTPTAGTRAFSHTRPSLRFDSVWSIGSPTGSPFTATITLA